MDPGASRAIGNIVGNAKLEARVGYFGICINPDVGSWLCSANASSLAAQLPTDRDPLNLVWVAQTFRESIVFPYLLIVAIILATMVLLLLATFPSHEPPEYEGEPAVSRMPSRAVSQVALAIIFVAAIFVLVSVLWQHTASVAAATIAANMGNGSVETGVGVTAMVLGWFGFALLIIVTIGLLVMCVSPRSGPEAVTANGHIQDLVDASHREAGRRRKIIMCGLYLEGRHGFFFFFFSRFSFSIRFVLPLQTMA